ncbi:hypothetical protein J2128_001433 [Methanomicrobium sp. W14]|uniref:hypothetical protein n=1 Tax=Methanomicrobium sp. W14 TaxID=2817839 RepID=UPI001AE1E9CC|nr:hypothetical protein [Methanomicrobium sp. W14]MBP2133479.1 hypothetical protein [Methanomicrobium sp. W14]
MAGCCKTNKTKTYIICLLLLFSLISAVVYPAAARYASPEGGNSGIDPGDTIFNGEQDLNFSKLQPSTPLEPPLWLAYRDGESAKSMQKLDSGAVLSSSVNVESEYLDSSFRLYNGSWGDAICTVSEPSGTIEVRTGTELGTDVNPASGDTKTPAVIPATMDVQFKLDSSAISGNGDFTSPWYEYTLMAPGGSSRQSITNINGDTVSLKNLIEDPSDDNNTLAFSIDDQNLGEGSYGMEFRAYSGNNVFYTADYDFEVIYYKLDAAINPSSVQGGDSATLTITGEPYMYYIIESNDPKDGRPELDINGDYDEYINESYAIVHPDWSGTINVPLDIPERSAGQSRTSSMYTIEVCKKDNPDDSTTARIAVEPGTSQEIELSESKLGIKEYYCLGDRIPIKGTLGASAKSDTTVYFYITGPNLNSNGAKPSSPDTAVVDGDNSTFDYVSVSKGQTDFTFYWDTSKTGLSSGTYTVFATVTPGGYDSREVSETDAEDCTDVDLNDASINVLFPDEAPGFFAQGDHIVSIWSARGSPARNQYTGTIRYYIIGNNFRYAGYTNFPLLKTDSSSVSVDQLDEMAETNDFPGYSGLDLGRSFSNAMGKGTYYVVYQHPMNNQVFDLYPSEGNSYNGTITKLVTTTGKTIDLSGLQVNAALNAITEAIDSPSIDDSYVTQEFDIEKPSIRLSPVLYAEVGNSIEIKGVTNLECPIDYPYNQIDLNGDELSLSLYTESMYYDGKTQSTYRIYSDRTYPDKTETGEDSRTFTFTIPSDISANMEVGNYVALIKCEAVKYEKALFFTLHEQGFAEEHGVTDITVDYEPEDPESYFAATHQQTTRATVKQTAKKTSPGLQKDESTSAPTKKTSGNGVLLTVFSFLLVLCTFCYLKRR